MYGAALPHARNRHLLFPFPLQPSATSIGLLAGNFLSNHGKDVFCQDAYVLTREGTKDTWHALELQLNTPSARTETKELQELMNWSHCSGVVVPEVRGASVPEEGELHCVLGVFGGERSRQRSNTLRYLRFSAVAKSAVCTEETQLTHQRAELEILPVSRAALDTHHTLMGPTAPAEGVAHVEIDGILVPTHSRSDDCLTIVERVGPHSTIK